jgi:hypothetical protein
MLPAWIAVGALAGALADWVAARLTAYTSSRTSLGIGAIAGAVLAAMVLAHPFHGWHGRLLPLWLWGWLVAADADLRAQELYDYHTMGLLALALAAGVADRQLLVSAAGAVAIGGLWLLVRGGLRWWTWRASAVLVGVGVIVLLPALHGLALARHTLAMGGSLGLVEQNARAVVSSARTATIAGFGIALAPLLAWIGAISRRANDGEAVVGGADVLLWAAVGAWFGLRWVWPVTGAAVISLGLAALVQLAARSAGWRIPWAADHLPVVPVVFVVLAIAS